MSSSSVNPPPPCPTTQPNLVEDRLQVCVRAWIRWLQGVFRVRQPGDYHWNANDTETDIYIAGQEPEEEEAPNKRARLIVQRGAAGWMGMSRDQQQTPEWPGRPTVFSDLVRCPVTITCAAREGLEAQWLAYNLLRLIPVFRRPLAKVGRMHHINTGQIQLSPETPFGAFFPGTANAEMKAIQLVIPITLQEVIEVDDRGFYPEVTNFLFQINS